jgi:hypothetical protein
MATFFAEVHSAIEETTALISAAETANPLIDRTIVPSRLLTFKLLILGAAKHLRLHLSTIATTFYFHFTRATEALMARPSASVFATG